MKKGSCMNEQIVYGVATVSDKGQMCIPVNIRKELELEPGDRLFVMKRKDGAGFTFVKLELMDRLMDRIRSDDKFFEKSREE